MRILNNINEIDLKNVKLTSIVKKSTPTTDDYDKDTNTGFLVDEYFFYTLKNKVSDKVSMFKRNLVTFDFYTEESYEITNKNENKLSINCEVDHLYREEEELLLINIFDKLHEFKNFASSNDDDKKLVEIITERINDDKFQVISANNFVALVINLEDTKMIYTIQYSNSRMTPVPYKSESIYITSNDIILKLDGGLAIEKFKELIRDLKKEMKGYEKFSDIATTLFGRNIFSFDSTIKDYNEMMVRFSEGINNIFINQKIETIVDNEYLYIPNNLVSKTAEALFYTKEKFDNEIERDKKFKIKRVIRNALEYNYYCDIINPFTGIKLNSKNEQKTINDITVIISGRNYKNYFENCCGVWIPCEDEEKISNFKASLEILDKFKNAE